MAKEFAKDFYNSKAWKQCRKGFIKHRKGIDGGLCQCCEEDLGYIVHHRLHLTPENINNPGISLNWNNLEFVCKKCHDKEHDFAQSKLPKVLFDENGDLIEF